MKIKIQTESGALEKSWYIQDLDCYTPEFLQQIILSLVYDSPQKCNLAEERTGKVTTPEISSPEDTISSKHTVEAEK